MAIGGGNQKRKGGKKGSKKKAVDTFSRKEWYDVKAPSKMFNSQDIGKTCANKSQGIKLASDSLKDRVFQVSLADLMNGEEDYYWRKLKLQVQDIRGKECLTDFDGMDVTRDFICALIRKWHSTITAFVDAKTKDGFTIRVFLYTFTRKHAGHRADATCYAKTNQIRSIRAVMQSEIKNFCAQNEMHQIVKKMTNENVAKDIEKKIRLIYPVQMTLISKVKVLKKPPFDQSRLLALHSVSSGSTASAALSKTTRETNLLQVEAE